MFSQSTLILHGLSLAQKEIESRIASMKYYYLLPGTKSDLIANYGFTKKTASTFLRITKVGWTCFNHDITTATTNHTVKDSDIEVPVLIDPPQFGWAVPVNDVPLEVTLALLDDKIYRCRFIESRKEDFPKMQAQILGLTKNPKMIEKSNTYSGHTHTWKEYNTTRAELTDDKLKEYLSAASLSELFLFRASYAMSIEHGFVTVAPRLTTNF